MDSLILKVGLSYGRGLLDDEELITIDGKKETVRHAIANNASIVNKKPKVVAKRTEMLLAINELFEDLKKEGATENV